MAEKENKVLWVEKKTWVKAGIGLVAVGILGAIFL